MQLAIFGIGALATIAWIVCGTVDSREPRIWVGIVASMLTVLAAGCAYVQHVRSETATIKPAQGDASVAANYLTPGNDPLPGIPPELSAAPSDEFLLFMGSTIFSTKVFPLVLIRDGEQAQLVIGKTNNRAWLTAKFFDKDKNLICKIIKNKITVNKGMYETDNPTPNILRVIDGVRDKVVLRLEFINPNAMRLLGDFYLRNGEPTVIEEEKQTIAGQTVSKNLYIFQGRPPDPRSQNRPFIQVGGLKLEAPDANGVRSLLFETVNVGDDIGTIKAMALGQIYVQDTPEAEIITKLKDKQISMPSEPDSTIMDPFDVRLNGVKVPPIVGEMDDSGKDGALYFTGRIEYLGPDGWKYVTRFCYRHSKDHDRFQEFGGKELNHAD